MTEWKLGRLGSAMNPHGIPVDLAKDGTPLDQIDFDALHRPFAEDIGWLVFAFSFLEKDLNWCVAALAGHEFYSRAGQEFIASTSSFTKRVGQIRKALLARSGPAEQWDSLEARLEVVNEFRNFVIHGVWGVFSRTAWGPELTCQVQKVNPRTKQFSSREITATDLQNAATEARRLGNQVMNYVQPIVDPRP